ncbi:DNA recombination protein RmuC [Paenibacillus sp.]|uniref:DNA recombination protein RmuC n=1 Tax=Paenibacillus sp. TaxID=58172 RepID=UPI002D6E5530|nr:DNA recombination protein RmuC [Paenibacillus sp.]HZG84943.1 DNA recombination protein RmuC [Paenibacillus sp.]
MADTVQWIVAAVSVLNAGLLLLLLQRANGRGRNAEAERRLDALARAVEQTERGLRDEIARSRGDMLAAGGQQRQELADAFERQQHALMARLTELTRLNESKLEAMRETVERKLTALQADNHTQLEQMRATVDEKLHATLERRLGESFQLVGERLELVHKGLGEMQSLASGVGDLKRVLTNVKTRGTMGEIQLDALLEQTLAPDQYERNAAIKKGTAERVDFVVKLPDKSDGRRAVLLPIDAKFPLEDYQRLLDAQESGDAAAAADAWKLLEARVKAEAKSIRDKYIDPPATTEFAVLFLPLEGLYAEVLRRPGLWDTLQREYRVVVTGPTTLSALLNSLQMGFRTLAIQKRTSEVWQVLGQVKGEFGKFGDLLEKTQKKLQEASNTLDGAAVRTRAIERRLRGVEELSAPEPEEALPPGYGFAASGDS